VVRVNPSPLGKLLARHSETALTEALADTRVVLVTGARQCGKSTLLGLVAKGRDAQWRNLDAAATRQAAAADPDGFVDSAGLMVIDEIQRVPDLLLAIKEQVDADPRPGRYLLSGSARVLALRGLPDTLPGRIETIELWPFSQGEIDGTADRFVDAIFDEGGGLSHGSAVTRQEYAERVVRGGFPEALARTSPRRRERFFDSYLADLVAREVSQLSEIERTAEMRALIRLLAARSGQLLVATAVGGDAGLTASTVYRYLSLLEEVFLVKRIPAWSRNVSTRAVGTPKLAFTDSGIAANLLGADVRSLLRPGGRFGPLLEGFVLMELARQVTWSRQRAELFHYRTKDKVEVDAVLENRRGEVVGIEVKASSTVGPDDFRGLRHLAARTGDDFIAGVVLYTGTQTLPFGPKMRAVPTAALWEI
jgi:uncharacterized protein